MNVFIAPKKTFEDLKRNSSWWVPFVISAVFGLLFGIVVVQKVDMRQFAQQQIDKSPAAQKQLERLTPEQREQNMAIRATITKVTFYAIPVFQLIGGLLVAAVLMAVFNFILGAEVSFARGLGVAFYASMPGVIRAVLIIISLLTSSDPSTIDLSGNPMPTNLGFFMDPQGNKVLYSLASALDIFTIWYVVLLGIGFAAASMNRKPSQGTGIATVFVCYGIVVLIGLGFKLAFS
ncbi:MAG TPA: YIP1 family protein [Candidatus Angelobacter sp.]